jgi:1,4-dihydroxy-6-naphthoate synthase
MMKSLRIGHSPDADDAFMFYGFASGQVKIPGHDIVHEMKDIQSLNQLAAGSDPYEVTAMSLHAFLDLEDRYEMLEVGTSVGRKYGPRIVARLPMSIADLAGKRIALPGPKTTATLAAKMLLPPFDEVHMDFMAIMTAVKDREVDAGVIIHEGQLTYAGEGLHLIADLGELFAERYNGLPLPLGVNCVRCDLPLEEKRAIAEAYRASVNIALTQRSDAIDYALQFGRGISKDLADAFVGMYVNEDSLAFADDLRQAIDIIRDAYKHHVPHRIETASLRG